MNKIVVTILTLIIYILSFANGGPIDGSTVIKTGQIKMVNLPGIEISSEIINLRIEGDYAIYDIKYRFYKEFEDSETIPDSITYGFPVDINSSEDNTSKYIAYFEMFFNNEPLKIKQQFDFSTFNDDSIFSDSHNKKIRINYKRKWYISKMCMNKVGYYELYVKYKVKNYFSDYLYLSESCKPFFSKRYLKYELVPASYWGDGEIDTFSVKINVQNLDSCNEKYRLFGLKDVKNSNGIIEFKQNHFSLKSTPYFSIDYTNKNQKLSEYFLDNRLNNDKIKSISSSSKINNSLANIVDLNFNTFWETKYISANKNEWIEFQFNAATISGIFLSNGDFSSEHAFQKSEKIKKIRMQIEKRNFPDTMKTKLIDTVITLNPHEYHTISKTNFAMNSDLVMDFKGRECINRIRFIILGTTNEKKKGVQISEIIFAKDKWTEE